MAESGPVASREPPEGAEWLAVLEDDTAPVERWVEAAASLVAPRPGQAAEQFDGVARRQNPALDLSGDALRGARPSVTALLDRRIEDTLAHEGHASCQLAVALTTWDPTALEKVELVFERALERAALMNCASILAIDRFRLGDRSALDRYAERITLQQIDAKSPRRKANNQGGTVTYDDGSASGWGVCGCGPPSPVLVKRQRACDLVAADLALHEARFDFERPIRDQDDEVTAMKAFLEAFEAADP